MYYIFQKFALAKFGRFKKTLTKNNMNTHTPKQTQLTQQTQLVSSPGESDDESEQINGEKDEQIWGRLFAIGPVFKSIGK